MSTPASPKQINFAIRLRDEQRDLDASQSLTAAKLAAKQFDAFVYQLSDLLTQNIRGRQDPTWRHYRYVSDGTKDRDVIEQRIRARYAEIVTLTDEQIAGLDRQEISHLIDDYKGGI